MIDERLYGLIELGLFFGLILGWAGWQWWGWRRWKREQAQREALAPQDEAGRDR